MVATLHPRIKSVVSSWLRKHEASQERNGEDVFVRFFISYMCLDAIMTEGSQEDRDQSKLEWLIENENVLRHAFTEGRFDKSALIDLKRLSPVADMRPRHSNNAVKLEAVSNFGEVVRFIYQIRCNFFHGGKSDQEERDRLLITHAGQFLMNWVRGVVLHTS